MRKRSTLCKIAVVLLTVIMVAMLFPATITAKAENPTIKPFYLVNWDRNIETNKYSNVYYMPYTWVNSAKFDANSTEINIGVYVKGTSSSNVKTAAKLVYDDFSQRPEGTRYLNLAALGTVFRKCVKDAIDFEDGIRLVADWVDRFLTEYKALGGVMDGFAIDLEYHYYTSFYLQSTYCTGTFAKNEETGKYETVTAPENLDILQDIVRNERVYQAKIRPQLKELEAQGLFTFYTGGSCKIYDMETHTYTTATISIDPETGLPSDLKASVGKTLSDNNKSRVPIPVSEITTMNRYDDDGGNATSRGTWNTVLQRHIVNSIDRAAFEPLLKHFPDAILSDYSNADVYSWDKGFATDGGSTGSGAKAGNASNGVYYGSTMSEYFYSTGSGSTTRQIYYKPVGQDGAVYEPDTAYATFEREINNNKRLVAEADRSGDRTNAWIPYYHYSNYIKSYGNTAYYSELVYHLGLSNPEPFFGYIIESEVTSKGNNSAYSHDPKYGDFQYTLGITNELLAELTRVAGASDRKALVTPIEWDDPFMLSGMYAGGRNIWRLTPDTTKISVADFKVKDQAPTFSVNGITITFPQGRIIQDTSITDIGSAGYWIETPADVEPVITRGANYINDNPAFSEDWEGYNPGTFTSIKGSLDLTQYVSTYRPDTYWTKSGAGTATIVESNGNKAMTLTGTTTLTNGAGKVSDKPTLTVPALVTAGDYFAKQQTWEVTVTMPSKFSGTMQLLNYTGTDGFKITSTGKVQYPYIYSGNSSGYFTNMSLSLTAGKTYTFKRVLDFAAMTCSYYVYDASGSLLKSQTGKRIISISTVSTIGISTSGVSGTVTIDNYKLTATGLTTNLDLYEEIPLSYFEGYTGYVRKLSDTSATRTSTTSYRVSWMNNSGAYKKAVLKNSKTGAVIEEVLMAPGESGYFTGTVEATASAPVVFALTTEAASAPATPDYDNGDFNWPSYADNMGICCYVGDQGYATLDAALAAAKSGQTVVMIGNATLTSTVNVTSSVKIQCNGNTISLADGFTGESAFAIPAGGALTWENGMNIDAGTKTAIVVDGGTLNVKGGQIAGQTGVLVTAGNLNVTGGTISATGNAILLRQNAGKSPATVTVTGGALKGNKAFLHTNINVTPSENLTVSISGAAITGAVETNEVHFVMQNEGGVYTLHGHILVIDAAVAATCTEDGLTQGLRYGCCDQQIVTPQEVVPAFGHNWVNATCSSSGICSICGDSNGGMAEHPYTTKVTQPTCTTDGYTTYTCPDCGHTYNDDIVPATGHTPGAAVEENRVEPVCATDGSYDSVIYCTVCTQQVSRTNIAIPAKGHIPGETVVENVVNISCTEDGSYDHATYCTVCLTETSRETFTTPSSGHNADGFRKDVISVGSCTTDDVYNNVTYCTDCGYEHTSKTYTTTAVGHKYVMGSTHVTCENCDYNEEIGTASASFLTGPKGAGKTWTPKLSMGMAPVYGTNDANGVVTAGNADNWTIKFEWAVGGIPTMTLRNAYIVNNTGVTAANRCMVLGGNTAWDIILVGKNEIHGNPNSATDSASGGESIRATMTGLLTIKGSSWNDSLKMNNTVANSITRVYGPLLLENATFEFNQLNTYYTYSAITMQYGSAGREADADLTVRNADLKFTGVYRSNRLIIMAGTSSSYSSSNAGEIRFENSNIYASRSGSAYQTPADTALIVNGPNTRFYIDRCDTYLYGYKYVCYNVPEFINCDTNITKTPHEVTTSDSSISTIRTTHHCEAGEPVIEITQNGDCCILSETVTYCTFCNARTVVDETDISSNAHTPGTKIELTDQRVAATRSAKGKYVFQTTCTACGKTWTEEEEFGAAILHYLTAAGDSGSAPKTNFNDWNGNNTSSSYYPKHVMNPGDEPLYFVASKNHATFTENTYLVQVTAADDWELKMEYPLYGTPVMTLKGLTLANNAGLWYGFAGFKTSTDLKIVVEEDSALIDTIPGAGSTTTGSLNLLTTGTVTITGPGKLSISSRIYHSDRGMIYTLGNLVFDHADVYLYRDDPMAKSNTGNAICAPNGDITVDGGKVQLVCYMPTSVTVGETTTSFSGTYRGIKYAMYANNITVKNGADVQLAASLTGNQASSPCGVTAINKLTISESSFVVSHGGQNYGKAVACGELILDFANGCEVRNSGSKFSYDTATKTVTGYPAGTVITDFSAANLSKYMFKVTPKAPVAKFEGARVGVEDDLILEFALDSSKVSNTGYAMITRTRTNPDGTITTDAPIRVELSTLKTETYGTMTCYVIPYAGIAAKEMHDQVTVVVYDADGNMVTETKTDSVYDYALRMLRGNKPAGYTDAQFAKLKSVLVDLLCYGTMAQVQFQHNDRNLANAVLNPTEWTYATASETYVPKAATVTGTGYMGTAFELKSNIAMLMGIRTTQLGTGSYAMVYVGDSAVGVRVDAEDSENNIAVFTFNGLDAAKGRTDVTWKFYKSGEDAETATPTLIVTDSMINYVGRMAEDYPYLENLMKYCDAAAAYFESINAN